MIPCAEKMFMSFFFILDTDMTLFHRRKGEMEIWMVQFFFIIPNFMNALQKFLEDIVSVKHDCCDIKGKK